MKRLLIGTLVLTSAVFCGVRVAALRVSGANRCMQTVTIIDALLSADSTIDIIFAPAENLGGDSNKARIIFAETSTGYSFEVADTFRRSRDVLCALDAFAVLAESYGTTIIPGSLWEVDSFNRCFESVPIFGPEGEVTRIRRKAHQTKLDPNIDPSVRLDTIFTKAGDIYTYLTTISNEVRDIPSVYGRASQAADLWLHLDRRWKGNFHLAIEPLNSIPPNWDIVYAYSDSPSFSALIDSNWVSNSSVLAFSNFDGTAGATVLGNIARGAHSPDDWFIIPEYLDTTLAVVFTVDPANPLSILRVDIFASDSAGVPVRELFVNYGPAGSIPSYVAWTDEFGSARALIAEESEMFFLFAMDGMAVFPEETTVMVSRSAPRCTISVRVLPLYSVEEAPRPEYIGLSISPNPFNAACRITSGSEVEIIDVCGRRVRVISVGEGGGALWDGRDESGKELPSGVYFMRTKSPAPQTIKACLMR